MDKTIQELALEEKERAARKAARLAAGGFDKVKYQREYMRKRRGMEPKTCPHCGGEL